MARPKWTKGIATWYKEDTLKPVLEYDSRRMEFILTVGNEQVDIPREAVDDLLKVAGWDVVRTSEVDTALEAIEKLRQEAALFWEYQEKLEKKLSEPGKEVVKFRKIDANLMHTVMQAIDADRKKISEQQAEIARLREGMSQIIGSAQKEINRLKEKCGEKVDSGK